MTDENKSELISYKLARAKECLVEAELLLNNGHHNTSVNRIYYACFYAVSALLITKRITPKKHAGVKQMFGLHFVTTGIVPVDISRFYTEIFEMRQEGDYEDLFCYEKDEALELFEPARRLIGTVESILYPKK